METYLDSCSKTFENQQDFNQFIGEREDDAFWRRFDTKDIRLRPLDDEIAQDLQNNSVDDLEEIIADTQKNTSLVLDTGTDVYLVRDCAIKTVIERAGIGGPAMAKLSKEVYSQVCNHGFKVGKGKSLVRFADGKLSALLSGDENGYSILEVSQLLNKTTDYLRKRFPNHRFISGEYNHSLATAVWDLNSPDLLKEYEDNLDYYGIKEGQLNSASLRLTTSNVGISGVNLLPCLRTANGGSLVIASPLTLDHRNATIAKFEENLNKVFTLYSKGLKKLTDFMAIKVLYPQNCMLGIMKHLRFTKKQTMETIDLFMNIHPDGPYTAFEVYNGMSRVIFHLQQNGATAKQIVQAEENLAKALALNWSQHDVPGDLKW